GKVDRKALPRPEGLVDEGRPFAAPRSPVEERLCAIFAGVLGVERVSIDENYFELGGDSIRSIRVRALAEEAGLPLTLQELFRHPTVRDLAAALAAGARAAGEAAFAVQPAAAEPFALVAPEDRASLPPGLEDAYPVTTLQAAMLVSSLSLEQTYRNVTGYVLRLPFDAVALAEAARQLVQRHEMLRTGFEIGTFAEPLQLVYRTAELPLEVVDLRGQAPDGVLDAWVANELKRQWDWSRPPLARLAAHRLTDETFRLSVSFHHAIADGWSVTGLMTELVERYKACLEGRPLEAAPAPVTFREYVALEREALASPESRAYWQAQLEGFAPAVPFGAPAAPAGYAAPQLENRYIEVEIDERVSRRVAELAREHGLPVKSLLLGAHLRVLAEATGQTDVMTGLVTNGRPEVAGGDQVVGLFLNTVPFRLKLGGGSWIELGRKVLAAETAMLPHRRFPLGEMQSGPNGQPPVEIYFNYTNFQVGQSQPEILDVVNAAWSSFPLAAEFYMDALAGRLRIFVEYDSRRFSEAHAQALGLCYRRALEALAENPEGAYDRPLLQEGERPGVALAIDPETARQWLERIDELTEEQVEMLLALIAEKEGT
ncbi:MAG TPA: condensation domain-containing protein, partial [Symbiobacteriaceae bacterium]|nr:condensation domain-containing protein [Symbiobacteriaceae bacterium]